MDRSHVTELEPQLVLVQLLSIGRRTSSRGPWIQCSDRPYVICNQLGGHRFATPLHSVICAFADFYDLGEKEMEIMEALALCWESTWGDLVRAAQKL